MKNKPGIVLFAIVVLIGVALTGCISEDEPEELNLEQQAKQAVEFLSDENIAEFYNLCNDEVKSSISVEEIDMIWKNTIATYGEFEEIVSTRATEEVGYEVVYVTCNFSTLGLLDIRIVYDEMSQIAGFQFVPTDVSENYEPPEYAIQDKFTEINVTIGSGKWELPGTLTLPEGEGPFSAVILVHGSGPNDRDETVGPNKPFKDLAWGIASQGIVVLRYEKRTKQYPEVTAALTNLTVQEEIIDDAIAAVDLLNITEKIDTNGIFLLGHSLGGMAAPRIASQENRLSGLILLAAPTRGLEDLFLDQTTYLANLDGIIDENEAEQIAALEKLVTKVKELNISEEGFVLGAPKAYWEDLSEYDPVETAENLSIPMLILQGQRDYQVTVKDDFVRWNESFAESANVTLQTYETLNHLFISGSGAPNNTEYLQAGNVEEQVINDIAAWIKKIQ
jgi:pimeloyl-ACP methyl ester carboxylesterase